MKLKFRNSSISNLFAAVFCSCAAVFLCVFGIIVGSIVGEAEHNILALKIFGSIFVIIWLVYFTVTFLLYKTVVITEETIILKRRKKIIWFINKEDISECVYERLNCRNFYSSNATAMLFKLKGTGKFAEHKINQHFSIVNCISLSFKNVKKMMTLGYNIRIIDSIHKQ